MTGFGKPRQNRKTRQNAKTINIDEAIRESILAYQQGNLVNAKHIMERAVSKHQENSVALGVLATVEKALGNNERASDLFKKSISINERNPDILHNYSTLLQDKDPEKAVIFSNKVIEMSPNNSTYLERNGYLKWKAGDFDNALQSTKKAISLKPDLFAAHLNLGGIHKDLGNLDQALASTLKSLEIKPEASSALYLLGSIKIAQGKIAEAKQNLLSAIEKNSHEYAAYYELSKMLESQEEARKLIKAAYSLNTNLLAAKNKYFIEFAMSNCFHKLKNYDEASKHLLLANENKLTARPSNANLFQQEIRSNLLSSTPTATTPIATENGKGRIFIVGMPRSGSTLLETILSMIPEIKDLGESNSLPNAIKEIQGQKKYNSDYEHLDEIYSQMEPIDGPGCKYTTDKNLINFIYSNHIAIHMPEAKIIHCRRNPMDNILSMYRSNLVAGHNYTASLEDSARILIAQEQAMQIQKKRHPAKIFTFDYDKFVNAPEVNLSKILDWLGLEFNPDYLHSEKSIRSIITASAVEARRPINNKSVGGWKNYEKLLKPALKILQENNIQLS